MESPPPYEAQGGSSTPASSNNYVAPVPSDADRSAFISSGSGLLVRSSLTTYGDVNIWIDVQENLGDLPAAVAPKVKEYALDPQGSVPSLNIVMFAIGDEDDLRPFISLAIELIVSHSHRIRIATQEIHEGLFNQAKNFLAGRTGRDGRVGLNDKLEMYPLSAPPDASLSTWTKNQKTLEPTLRSLYRSTFSTSTVPTNSHFAADLIISAPNVPCQVSIAELLGLPLHILSTNPCSPTIILPHSGAIVQRSNTNASLTNYLSYPIYENQVWHALGRIINEFRVASLGLPTLTKMEGPGVLDRLKVPFTYCWSPSLLKKPEDWREHIDVTGFIFDHQEQVDFHPSDDLLCFLENGKEPVYVKLDLPNSDSTNVINSFITALLKTNNRAIVDVKGLQMKNGENPDIFIVSEVAPVPYQWLLSERRISTICHSDSASLNLAAMRAGIPAIIVAIGRPLSFWGRQIHQVGIAARAVSSDALNCEAMVSALEEALSLRVQSAAKEYGSQLSIEDGTKRAAEAIHKHLPLLSMRCDIIPSRAAIWYSPEYNLHLSGIAAGVLVDEGKLSFKTLEPNRPKEYPVNIADSDPIIGGAQAFFLALTASVLNVLHMFNQPIPEREIDISTQQPVTISQVQNPSGGWTWSYEQATRQRVPITDFRSGLKEARDELTTGVKDGMKALVMEPLYGFKERGPIGGVFGLVRGGVSLVTRPLGSGISAVRYGAEGAIREVDGRSTKLFSLDYSSPAESLRPSRKAASIEELRQITSEDRKRILEEFKHAKSDEATESRKVWDEAISLGKTPERSSDGIEIGRYTSPLSSEADKSSKKWWKGKGKGKGKERVSETTLGPHSLQSSSGLTSGDTSSHADEKFWPSGEK
ncbi:UDP-glucose,sterol transferase [Cryptococcus neoformans C23]|uniref:UDP-glucose,sterol transferase n=1 Tax=Cryptococcus neoformans (strain H99 / ATCC 208821 / CBS 10515 / FGSC 9487) TaxID=235443 RepID=J9VQ23_CRYN9|nr:UDP-glucose,sterol transferase [Cryptococcus neoformans var. grubii H99]AUB26266.1 UDP-glucose,sterol transferase [Cryptococcus neoformans var. grubii]OWZ30244.1 UDP-glucose,sterol transferase [Cryptococcus neoformans var. grubii AD2-60a]OWZ41963.1 UDP-glucose,sterol transferase [Cryptococcus neoformans var. grubii C23]OXC83493.1 UDP-glucose,sterol transferase [Cryptococcus neoformans var. grubii AD1-7a]OXG30000.1 UDP-glucose,sterol transferase [Cryptococcus neoformans var. grubii Bt15]OXG|eukprot:XP_012050843.1 UDP-glucose,sterol transferase [Cryptococcus neoformans var. grubii H99]